VSGLLPGDRAVLSLLRALNGLTRSGLCTLARHGAAVRRDDPERAARLAEVLSAWPLFKGGQFLFDLLEWEDFMLDGDPPPLWPAGEAAMVLAGPVAWLRALLPAAGAAGSEPAATSTESEGRELPELRAHFRIYDDVVIGAVTLAGAANPLMVHRLPRPGEAAPPTDA
jgi:hypothetical protein